MSNIPAEGTRAGDIFAIMVVLAPVTSLLFSALIKSRPAAFFCAMAVSSGIIGVSFWLADPAAAVSGINTGGLIFGGWALAVSLFLALTITVGRGLIKYPEVEPITATIEPTEHTEPNDLR